MRICSKSSIPKSISNSQIAAILIGIAVLLLSLFVSLLSGTAKIEISDIWRWLFSDSESLHTHNILLYARLPRSIAALLCGGALAVAGLLLQTALSNPLASAGTIGINSGAGLMAVAAPILFPGMLMAKPVLAFFGALVTAVFVYGIAQKSKTGRNTIIMAGVAVASLLSAGTDAIVTLRPDSLPDKAFFFIGGFAHITMQPVMAALPLLIIGLIGAMLLSARLNLLILGDEVAASLGLSVNVCRFLSLMCAALLAATAVCVGGLLGFVGLIVPHISKRLMGNEHKTLVPFTAIMGSALVILCDILARVLFSPYELPVGIILSALGAPFFLFLLLRKGRPVI